MKLMNEEKELPISILDNEARLGGSLSSPIGSIGYETTKHASAKDFFMWGRWDQTACLVLRMLG